VFENRVLRGKFGPKREELTGRWSEMDDEEIHSLFSSPDIIN
jgi:hypothetical protein